MSDSESDDAYGPPLPPGFGAPSRKQSSSEDDTYGPSLPSKHNDHTTHRNVEKSVPCIGPNLPPIVGGRQSSSSNLTSERNRNIIGPSMPPHLMKNQPNTCESDSDPSDTDDQHIIGPALPPGVSKSAISHSTYSRHSDPSEMLGPQLPSVHTNTAGYPDSDRDDGGVIGPSLDMKAMEGDTSTAAEFEERSKRMRDRLTGKTDESEKAQARETWMTELPEQVGVSFGLDNRQFRKTAAPTRDLGWTDTPEDKQDKETNEKETKKRKTESDVYIPSEKERQTAQEIEAYNKSKRPDSLLDMHEKKMKKEKKKDKDEPKVRRPFDRDLDLHVNKLDNAQRKAIIKRSQELGSKFKSGGTGTSFL